MDNPKLKLIRQAINMITDEDLSHWSDAHDKVTLEALRDLAFLSQAEGGEERLSDALIEHEAGVYGHYDSNLDQWEFIGSSVIDFGRSIADQAHSAPVQEAITTRDTRVLDAIERLASTTQEAMSDEEKILYWMREAKEAKHALWQMQQAQEAVSERTAEPTADFGVSKAATQAMADRIKELEAALAVPATEPTADKRKMIYNAWAMLKAEDNDGAYRVLSELIGWNPDTAKPIAAPATEPTAIDDKTHPRFMAGYDAGLKDGRYIAASAKPGEPANNVEAFKSFLVHEFGEDYRVRGIASFGAVSRAFGAGWESAIAANPPGAEDRLIAAAPELLSALKGVMRDAIHQSEIDFLVKGIGIKTPMGKAIMAAFAAITKATGSAQC